MLTLYDAPRCPYCARARIAFAEKAIDYETVVVDLDHRPAWIIEKNPPDGRVPVLELDGGRVVPESLVIMRLLEDLHPDPPLLPADPVERALVNFTIERFDARLGSRYYRRYRGEAGGEDALDAALADLDRSLEATGWLAGDRYTLADIAYVPWVLRAESRYGMDVRRHDAIARWLARLEERPAIAAEVEVVAALAR